MVFVGAVALPHSTMSFDGQGLESAMESCRERYKLLPQELQTELSKVFSACTKACEKMAELKPELVVVHSPHGISLSRSISVYLNETAKGNAQWNGEWQEFEVDVPLDKEMAFQMITQFEEDKIDVQGVKAFANTEAPLRWGEVIPLWYLNQEFKKLSLQPKFVILSQALRNGENFSLENIAIGKSLARFVEKIDKRVVIVIPVDLAHTHTNKYSNILLYLPDPRWILPCSDKAELFDRAIEGWAKSCDLSLVASNAKLPTYDGPIDWDSNMALAWLQHADKFQTSCMSCGIGGCAVLHGVLSKYLDFKIVKSKVFGKFAPTYYGMIVVTFTVVKQQ